MSEVGYSQKQNNPNRIYIAIDSTKQKWGDWGQPEWLRYFGLDFGDVNNDGKTDIVSGRYIYQNPAVEYGRNQDGVRTAILSIRIRFMATS